MVQSNVVVDGAIRASFRQKLLSKCRAKLTAFVRKEDGPTAVEYAVMLALIIVVCLAAIGVVGTSANNIFGQVGASLASVGT